MAHSSRVENGSMKCKVSQGKDSSKGMYHRGTLYMTESQKHGQYSLLELSLLLTQE